MKQSISSFDIYAEVYELKNLINVRVNKVFQVTKDELKLVLNVRDGGKRDLVIEAGKRIHLTEYPKPAPSKPSMFVMALRKYIGNGILLSMRQVGFDRIIELVFRGREGEEYILVVELFGNGNVLLLNPSRDILAVMRPKRYSTREVVTKAKYEFPPQRINPFELEAEEIKDLVNNSKGDLVRTIATNLGLGGVYAEEICLRAGIEKSKMNITLEEGEIIWEKIHELKDSVEKEKPRIIFEGELPVDITPVKLEIYRDKKSQEFESMNEALDTYFTTYELDHIEELRRKKYEEEVGKYRSRLKDQTSILKKYLKGEKEYKEIGDLIYLHYKIIEELMNTIKKARKDYSWKDIKRKFKESNISIVKEIIPSTGDIILILNGNEVKIDIRKDVFENSEFYYSKGKKFRGKIKGTLMAVRKTVDKIEEIKAKGVEAYSVAKPKPKKRVTKKQEWYEKFRWFISSDDFLVIGGKDATSNEMVFKKHCSPDDIFIHADIHGAPVVVIKTEDRDVPEDTIQEAFEFAAAYSRAWKHGFASLEVYRIKPEQVSKRAESGEYVAKGSFVVRGKRNYGVGHVELAIGVIIDDDIKVISGPEKAISSKANYYVIISPGRKKSLEVSREIKTCLIKKAKEEHKDKLLKLNHDEIQRMLPSGTSEIKKIRR